MKADIHPTYYEKAEVTCSCGEKFFVGSTMAKIQIEICSACHPFFSGQDKVIDTAGRVEKFKKRRTKSVEIKTTKKAKISKKSSKNSENKDKATTE